MAASPNSHPSTSLRNSLYLPRKVSRSETTIEAPRLSSRSVEEKVPLVEYSTRILSARKVVNFRVRRLERPSHCSSAVPTLKRSHAKHLARLSDYAVQASLCRHVHHLASLLLCIDGNSLKQKLCTLATLHWAAVQIEHTSLPDCGGCRGRWQGQAARTLGDQRQDLQPAPEHPLDGAGRASEQRTRNCPG